MSASNTAPCARCGGPLAAGGDCPRCLLELGLAGAAATGLGGQSDAPDPAGPPPSGRPPSGPPPSGPPSLEDVRAAFPELEIEALLGRGGMGAVFRARQPRLDRLVALKVLPRAMGRQAGFAERFEREARALARLSHPGIVAVHDHGVADGLSYLVMEYVDGVNLRQLLRAGSIAPARALAIARDLCDALQFAHDEGVVHRDIKPENVLVDTRGRVKVADFGLAKLSGGAGELGLTRSDQVMGTPHYMAPEQLERPAEVDHRADLFALGVVLYEMLTGGLPRGHFEPPSQRVRVDVKLDEIVLRALEREPARRYQHALEIKTDVDALPPESPAVPGAREEEVAAAPARVGFERSAPGRRTWMAGAAFLALWILLGAAWNQGLGTFAFLFLAWIAGTGWMLLECVRAHPRWLAALTCESLGRRLGRVVGLVLGTGLALGMVVVGHLAHWESGVSNWTPHARGPHGVSLYWSNNPWALLRQTIDAERLSFFFPADLQPRVAVLGEHSSVPLQLGGIEPWFLILGGFALLAVVLVSSTHRREAEPSERRAAWHVGTELACLSLGSLVLLWIGPPLNRHDVRTEVSSGLATRVPRERALERLRAALARHGLTIDVQQQLAVLAERSGSTLAEASVLRAEASSPWKRWRTTFRGASRATPQVWATLVARRDGGTTVGLRAGLYDPRQAEIEEARAVLAELAEALSEDDPGEAAPLRRQ